MTMERYCISIPSAGGYEQLQVKPLAADGWTQGAHKKVVDFPDDQYLVIRVHAAGVNYADVIVRWGLYNSAKEYVGWPITPGFEFSGVVEEKGVDCNEFEIGDEIFGVTLFGAYATHVRIPKKFAIKRPSTLTIEEAAGMPVVACTAYYAIHELAHVKKGQSVLVHSAAGGVGSMLVQMCKIAGCRVVGVVGATHKVEAARQLGCDDVIDKSAEELWSGVERVEPKGFKAVFDANGTTFSDSYKHVAPGGKLVVYGFHSIMPQQGGRIGTMQWLKMGLNLFRTPSFSPTEMVSSNRSVLGFNLSYMFSEYELFLEAFEQILSWFEKGQLRMPAVQLVPMKNVAEAHRRLESAQTVGKLVLVCAQESKEGESTQGEGQPKEGGSGKDEDPPKEAAQSEMEDKPEKTED